MEDGQTTLTVDGIDIELVRKRIKNVNFTVFPPDGRVRVSAPSRLGDAAVRRAVEDRLEWIRRQQENVRNAGFEAPPEPNAGERHYLWGRPYRLRVVEGATRTRVSLDGSTLMMHARPNARASERQRALDAWYRTELEGVLPDLIDRWSSIVGVRVAGWRIRKMSSRWGSCDPEARRICVNLQLAQELPQHLEYIVVHELVHFWEPSHDRDFARLMDRLLPEWRARRRALNKGEKRDEVVETTSSAAQLTLW